VNQGPIQGVASSRGKGMGSSDSKIKAALTNPGMAFDLALAIVRGIFFRFKLGVFGPRNVRIGKGLRIYTRLYIKGPGTVIIGERFSCNRNVFKETTLMTHDADAVIRIGDGNYFGGVSISCVKKVEIGDDNLFGNVVIMDSDIIPHPNLQLDGAWKEKWAREIAIGNKTWLAVNTVVLKGVTLGDECVLSAGSVAASSAEPRSLLLGVPARRVKSTREES
jgi:acetyltransferase-like isoleucine patch superfamily enzyme